MSYSDAGGFSQDGCDDTEYCGYGGGFGDPSEEPSWDIGSARPDPEPQEAMIDYLMKAETKLIQFEKNKYAVKSRPYCFDMYDIDRTVPRIQKTIDHNDPKDVETKTEKIKRLKSERDRLQRAELAIVREKLEAVKLMEKYIHNRIMRCSKDEEQFEPDYDPHKDLELQRRLKDAEEYQYEYDTLVIKDKDFEDLTTILRNYVLDYGVKEMRYQLDKIMNTIERYPNE